MSNKKKVSPLFVRLMMVSLCLSLLFMTCKKDHVPEPVTPQSPINYNNSYSLAGQTWVLYQYIDTNSNVITVNDTLHFTSDHQLTWGNMISTYSFSVNSHDNTKSLAFHNTPYSSLATCYNNATDPALSQSAQFNIPLLFAPNFSWDCYFIRL
ncbi:hypothetical protein BH11BAC7_BH11BAC7_19920 [soil metagenome]